MPDDELRQSERDARANPSDREAGWRHARALERRGDRRGHLVALSRLSRSGDPDAAALVRDVVALAPVGPQRGRGRRCEQLREPWRVRSSSIAGPFRGVFGATERVLYLKGDETLVAVDTVRLVELWRRPRMSDAPFAFRGEDVVVAEGSDVVLLDGETGRELLREGQRGEVAELVAENDRAVALVGAHRGRLWLVVGLDLGETFGRELWKRRHPHTPPERHTLHGIVDGVVVIRSPLDGVRIEDGKADSSSVELARRLNYHGGLREDPPRLAASCAGWGLAVASGRTVSQGIAYQDGLDVSSPDGARRRVTSIGAATSPAVGLARWRIRSVSIAGSLGYVVSIPDPHGAGDGRAQPTTEHDRDVVRVLGVDLASARVCLDVGVPVDLQGEFNDVEGIAVHGALLVVVATPAACTLIRLEAAPAGADHSH